MGYALVVLMLAFAVSHGIWIIFSKTLPAGERDRVGELASPFVMRILVTVILAGISFGAFLMSAMATAGDGPPPRHDPFNLFRAVSAVVLTIIILIWCFFIRQLWKTSVRAGIYISIAFGITSLLLGIYGSEFLQFLLVLGNR